MENQRPAKTRQGRYMNERDQMLNDEGRDLWNQKAAFWDSLHGDDGNQFHRQLISPSVESLLTLQSGERVLDIACGNGAMARRLVALGGLVTACDFSSELIELAKARQQSGAESIQYHVIDATDEDALVALGEGQFDAIVNTMALMDIPVIAPLFRAVKRLLAPKGRFVFASAHPAFNSSNPVFVSEKGDTAGVISTVHSVKISVYLDVPPVKGGGAPNEPNPHYYYHRPLSELLGEAFAAGLILDGIEEPGFARELAAEARPLTWLTHWQIPPIMTARLRVR